MRLRLALPAIALAACASEVTETKTSAPAAAARDGEIVFAKGTGETGEALVRTIHGVTRMRYSVVGDLAIAQGDMVLGRVSDLRSRQKAGVGITDLSDRWENTTIPVKRGDDLLDETWADIELAIAEWEAKTPFRFPTYDEDKHDDYVLFTDTERACWSSVGRQGGEQVINIANWEDSDDDGMVDTPVCGVGAVIHEIGHAVGLVHEQSRQDRDEHLRVLLENVEEDMEHNFDVEAEHDVGEFDWNSAMLYGPMSFSVGGKPTLIRRDAWSWRKIGVGFQTLAFPTNGVSLIGQYGDFNNDGRDDLFTADGKEWAFTSVLTGTRVVLRQATETKDLKVGDFTGDGVADVMWMSGANWYLSESGTQPFVVVVPGATERVRDLLFGDFDGDDRLDAVKTDAKSIWYVSWGCAERFVFLNAGNATLKSMAAGQFDDVPGDEIFVADGKRWTTWSYTGLLGKTQVLKASDITRDKMLVGNFVGDFRADVLAHVDDEWQVSDRGVGDLSAYSEYVHPNWFRTPDLDGDGVLDWAADGFYPTRRLLSAGDVAAVAATYFGSFNVSYSGTSSWQKINASNVDVSKLHVADFTGDGRADLFHANGDAFLLSDAGTGAWETLQASGHALEDLLFGDFDGDGDTDVLYADGTHWKVSNGGREPWVVVNTSSYTAADGLRIGDFDDDDHDDVFRADGTEWHVSYGATSTWSFLNTSGYTVDDGLRLGDFDGDGRADVFRADGTEWLMSSGGTAPWQFLNTSGFGVDDLLFGDFDGDDHTDVLQSGAGQWKLSSGAVSKWKPINTSARAVEFLRAGDFDNDGADDVFTTFEALAN